MSKITRLILERIVERCAAIVAGIVGSTFSTIYTQRRAEQQSELEHLAVAYEKEGKFAAADTIRQHLRSQADHNPAGDAIAIMENVLTEQSQSNLESDDSFRPVALPKTPSQQRRKRRPIPNSEEC